MKRYLSCLITIMLGFSGAVFCSVPVEPQEEMPKNLSSDPRFFQYRHNGNLITLDRETEETFVNGKKVPRQKRSMNCARDLVGWTVYRDPYEAHPYDLEYTYLALAEQKKLQALLQQDKKAVEEQAAAKESSDKKK